MAVFGSGKIPVKVNNVTQAQTSNGIHVTGKCAFGGVVVKTDGANAATISVYDGTDNTGTLVLPAAFVVDGSNRLWSVSVDPGFLCTTGVYVEISGTGASVMVVYDQG